MTPSVDGTVKLDSNDPFESIRNTPTQIKQIWAVGGGKGGVGKSLVASSLAIALARLGYKTVAADLDLGGANLHTTLGMDLPKLTLSDFFSNRVSSLQDCLVPSGIPNLQLLSGAQDSINISNISPLQKIELMSQLKILNTEYLICDLGAGTSYNAIDFFLLSDSGYITMLPEPTSIENGYRFIKSAYYRYLSNSSALKAIRPLIELAMDPKNAKGLRSPAELFHEVSRTHPEEGVKLKQQIEKFKPKLIINQVRTQTDVDIGVSVKTVCRKYFGIDLDFIAHLDYDSTVWQAVRKKRPLLLEFPHSRIVANIDQILSKMVRPHEPRKRAVF